MAEYGKWTQKGATLSDATAIKEYGVTRDFIEDGIRAGKLEYRESAIWGNPFLRLLRGQLESYITEKLGANHLNDQQWQTELRKIQSEIASLKRKITVLEKRRAEMVAGNGE